MFLHFFLLLKEHGLPVSIREYLDLLAVLEKGVGEMRVDDFYAISRTTLIKHEKYLDRFDMLFGNYFKGMELIPDETFKDIPEDWLRKNMERFFTKEEMEAIEAMGGLDKLMERFKELMEEQQERHEGGNKWIGTGGTSPFGANGYNPEGFRIGQAGSRNRSAVKVWDKRDFRNLDDNVELNTRNMKMALRRLRKFTREGIQEELDLDTTIRKTANNAGILDLELVASKKNRVKVLLLLDVGGSMDDHISQCSQLFSAAKHEFKHLEFFYFHNCLYESVWKDNNRREKRIPTFELLNKYNRDYKVIFVGDASMSPYEIVYQGGSIEHWNDEPGIVWLNRIKAQFPDMVWLNPIGKDWWGYTQSIKMIQEFTEDRMFPLTVSGLTDAMKSLKGKYSGSRKVRG